MGKRADYGCTGRVNGRKMALVQHLWRRAPSPGPTDCEMTHADLSDIRIAWQRATDADVLCALRNPTDYPAEVFEVIEREAAGRNLRLTSGTLALPGDGIRTSTVVRWARELVLNHRLAVAAGVGLAARTSGFATPWAVETMAWGVWSAMFWTGYLLALTATAWPLRRYRTIATVTLAASSCYVLPGIAIIVFTYWGRLTAYEWLVSLAVPLGVILGFWATTCLVLCGVAYIRNRFIPIYPKDCCRKCGYDLRGTPGRVCSECGMPFTRRGVREW